MELGSVRNGIGFMIMLIIMIWVILIKVLNMFVLFLEALLSILILAEEELVENPQRQVFP